MKKTIFSTMIASLLVFVGCQNEELVNESTDNSNGKKVTLTAHIAGSADSRVTLSESTMYDEELGKDVTKILVGWKDSDEEFTMYDQNDNSALFEQVEDNKFECDDFRLDGGGQYTAYYGYVNRTYSHLSSQNGTLDDSEVLMQAVVNDLSEIEFTHKTAILEFMFNNGVFDNTTITSIVMNNVKNVSGGSITVSRDGVANAKKGDIYIFLPIEEENDYTTGHTFNFTVTAKIGENVKEYIGSLTIRKAIEAGKRYTAKVALREFVVLPEGEVFQYEINNKLKNNTSVIAIRFVAGVDSEELTYSNAKSLSNDFNKKVKYRIVDDNATLEIFTDFDVFKFNTDCQYMLSGQAASYLQKIQSIDFNDCVDTSNVEDMSYMFCNSKSLTNIYELSNFNTSNVTNMSYMFKDCKILTSIDLSNFNTSKVTTMASMFESCAELSSINLSKFNTSKVKTMAYMFSGCAKLTSIDLSNLDASNLTDMGYMFSGCGALTSLGLSNFDTSNVQNMSGLFSNCYALTTPDLSKLNTSNVTDMSSMFWSCTGLTELNLSTFDTSKVTNVSGMFNNCKNLDLLNLNGFDFTKVTTNNNFYNLFAWIGMDTYSTITSIIVNQNAYDKLKRQGSNLGNTNYFKFVQPDGTTPY